MSIEVILIKEGVLVTLNADKDNAREEHENIQMLIYPDEFEPLLIALMRVKRDLMIAVGDPRIGSKWADR